MVGTGNGINRIWSQEIHPDKYRRVAIKISVGIDCHLVNSANAAVGVD